MGIYVFGADVLGACLRDGAIDFGRDVLPAWVGRARIFAHRFRDAVRVQSSYWRDVGTIDAYWRAHMDLLSANAPFDMRDPRWPIGELHSAAPHVSLVPPQETAAEVTVRSSQVHRCAISPSARIGEGAVLEECIVLPGARVGAGCRLTKVIVGPDCHIPDGISLGEDGAAFGLRSPGGITVITAADVVAHPLDASRGTVRSGCTSASPMPPGESASPQAG